MTWTEIASAIRRRWYVVVLGLAATAALCFTVMDRVPQTYESTATVTLVPGPGSIPEAGNPLLYLGGLTQARDVLLKTVASEEVQASLIGGRGGVEASMTADPTTAAPMIRVAVAAEEPDVAREVRDEAVALLAVQAGEIQVEAGAPPESRFTTFTLTADDEPAILGRDRQRAVLTSGAVGLAATLLGAAAVDGLAGHGSRRRPRPGAAERRGRAKRASTDKAGQSAGVTEPPSRKPLSAHQR